MVSYALDEEMLRTLIVAGADINLATTRGETSLHGASLNDIDKVRILIRYGADVNARDSVQEHPLHYAERANRLDIVQALVEAGADLNGQDDDGWSVLLWAIVASHFEIASYLLERGAATDLPAKDGDLPLIRAVLHADLDPRFVDLLIEFGADVNAVDEKQGVRPIHIAALKGLDQVVIKLHSAGADLNAMDHEGLTALHFARAKGRTSIVALLSSLAGKSVRN
jgi:ankyrin repeat protein